jgi:protein TonB
LRHALAGLCGLAGCAAVFAFLAVMNQREERREVQDRAGSQGLVLAPERKPPEVRRRPERPPPSRARSAARAPAPRLATALSGNAFGIPSLEGVDLTHMDGALLSAERQQRELVMTEESVDQPPRPLVRASPAYPPRARARGLTGQVVLGLLIGPQGEVQQIQVLEASPPGVFDQAALDAARQWRFEPARYRAQPVRVWARQVVHFQLS